MENDQMDPVRENTGNRNFLQYTENFYAHIVNSRILRITDIVIIGVKFLLETECIYQDFCI